MNNTFKIRRIIVCLLMLVNTNFSYSSDTNQNLENATPSTSDNSQSGKQATLSRLEPEFWTNSLSYRLRLCEMYVYPILTGKDKERIDHFQETLRNASQFYNDEEILDRVVRVIKSIMENIYRYKDIDDNWFRMKQRLYINNLQSLINNYPLSAGQKQHVNQIIQDCETMTPDLWRNKTNKNT